MSVGSPLLVPTVLSECGFHSRAGHRALGLFGPLERTHVGAWHTQGQTAPPAGWGLHLQARVWQAGCSAGGRRGREPASAEQDGGLGTWAVLLCVRAMPPHPVTQVWVVMLQVDQAVPPPPASFFT